MIEIKSTIEKIFPTPIYFSNINRKLTNEEKKFVNFNKKLLMKNEGNYTSTNNYILENEKLKNIKEFLGVLVKNYFDNIVSPSENITPYITQSWLNYTKKGEFHHTHCHPNSYISGVFYIESDKGDGISFNKNIYHQIKIEPIKLNTFNSDSWDFSIKTGDVVLFPSHLQHCVKQRKSNKNVRTSLAFNVFLKGIIGYNHSLTELIL